MRPYRLLHFSVFLLIAGCGDSARETDPGAAADRATTPADHGHTAARQDGHDLEQGEPVPFLSIMRQLSADLTGFTHALWIEDFRRMNQHSAAIAHHAPIDPADIRRFQEILGEEWAAFEEADHAVHEASEELHHAVTERDLEAILTRLDALQRGCVSCHTAYRERVLSEGSTDPRR